MMCRMIRRAVTAVAVIGPLLLAATGVASAQAPPPASGPRSTLSDQQTVAIRSSKLVQYVPPSFAPRAASSELEIVILMVTVGADGKALDVKGVEGPMNQALAARDAVQQWVFPPPAESPAQVFVGFNTAARQLKPESGGGHVPPRGFRKTKDVKPTYPAAARKKRVQGVVLLDTIIDPTGLVANARVVSGEPVLAVAALEAVLRWEFMAPGFAMSMTTTMNFAAQ